MALEADSSGMFQDGQIVGGFMLKQFEYGRCVQDIGW